MIMTKTVLYVADIRPYKCQYCDYYARTNSQLKVHMMRHQGKSTTRLIDFLAWLFSEEIRGIAIALALSSCKNFDIL